MSLERALKRPLSHSRDSARTQWETDKALGILDWDPTPEESEQYIQKRAKMGDKAMVALLAKRKGKTWH